VTTQRISSPIYKPYQLLFALSLLFLMLLSTACGTEAHAAPSKSKPASTLAAPINCPNCWHPALKTSWQWQLSGTLDTSFNVTMYDIDMFNNDASTVKSLHQANRIVICYIDAGTWENWRPDASQFPSSVKGKSNGWPGEVWLDIRNLSIIGPLLQHRMDMCKSRGYDGVEFDNVDGYSNDSGFPLKASDQLTFNSWLANEAHKRGLSVALKNDPEQAKTLLPYFDWELDEECFNYNECDSFLPFIQAGKAVMEVEYDLDTSAFCPQANKMNFNSLKKHHDQVDAWRVACR
jgi:hypothetical protein